MLDILNFHDLIDQMAQPALIVDREGYLLQANEPIRQLLESDGVVIAGRKRVPVEDLGRLRLVVDRAIRAIVPILEQGGRTTTLELELRGKGTTGIQPIKVTITGFYGLTSKRARMIVGFLVLLRFGRGAKRGSTQDLVASCLGGADMLTEHLLEQIFEALPRAAVIVDDRGEIIKHNERFVIALGEKDPSGRRLDDLLAKRGFRGSYDALAKLLDEERVESVLSLGDARHGAIQRIPLAGHLVAPGNYLVMLQLDDEVAPHETPYIPCAEAMASLAEHLFATSVPAEVVEVTLTHVLGRTGFDMGLVYEARGAVAVLVGGKGVSHQRRARLEVVRRDALSKLFASPLLGRSWTTVPLVVEGRTVAVMFLGAVVDKGAMVEGIEALQAVRRIVGRALERSLRLGAARVQRGALSSLGDVVMITTLDGTLHELGGDLEPALATGHARTVGDLLLDSHQEVMEVLLAEAAREGHAYASVRFRGLHSVSVHLEARRFESDDVYLLITGALDDPAQRRVSARHSSAAEHFMDSLEVVRGGGRVEAGILHVLGHLVERTGSPLAMVVSRHGHGDVRIKAVSQTPPRILDVMRSLAWGDLMDEGYLTGALAQGVTSILGAFGLSPLVHERHQDDVGSSLLVLVAHPTASCAEVMAHEGDLLASTVRALSILFWLASPVDLERRAIPAKDTLHN